MSKGNRIRNKKKTARKVKNTVLVSNEQGNLTQSPFTAFFTKIEFGYGSLAAEIISEFKHEMRKDLPSFDHMAIAALAISANNKIWQHHKTNPALSHSYNEVWEMVDEYALNNLKGEELNFYIRATD